MPLTNDIHPIFSQRNFSEDFDYNGALLPVLRLLSRIITSPQSLHYFYVILFGKNMIADRPVAFEGLPLHECPQAVACNKGILELNGRDKAAVRRHLLRLADGIRFELKDLGAIKNHGHCRSEDGETTCTIAINKTIYELLLKDDWTDHSHQFAQFWVVRVLLHELAHAASIVWFDFQGNSVEDFFEDSLIAEAGFEYQARLHDLATTIELKTDKIVAWWRNWQAKSMASPSYKMDELCRDPYALPDRPVYTPMSTDFVARLFTDHFWEVTMLRGPLALVDDKVQSYLEKYTMYKRWYPAILPESILDLYNVPSSLSYAARKYRHLRNPHLELRTLLRDEKELPNSESDESAAQSDEEASGSADPQIEEQSAERMDID